MKQIAESLQPASEFLSVLGSFAMCAFYARAMGEAAFRRLRGCAGSALGGYQIDWRWARMLFQFVAAAALAAPTVLIVQGALGAAPSPHASFTAVLVSTLWPTCLSSERASLYSYSLRLSQGQGSYSARKC